MPQQHQRRRPPPPLAWPLPLLPLVLTLLQPSDAAVWSQGDIFITVAEAGGANPAINIYNQDSGYLSSVDLRGEGSSYLNSTRCGNSYTRCAGFSPDTTRLYVCCGEKCIILDATTPAHEVIGSWLTNGEVVGQSIIFRPDGRPLITVPGDETRGKVMELDASLAPSVTQTWTVANRGAITLDANGTTLYVSQNNATISTLDLQTGAVAPWAFFAGAALHNVGQSLQLKSGELAVTHGSCVEKTKNGGFPATIDNAFCATELSTTFSLAAPDGLANQAAFWTLGSTLTSNTLFKLRSFDLAIDDDTVDAGIPSSSVVGGLAVYMGYSATASGEPTCADSNFVGPSPQFAATTSQQWWWGPRKPLAGSDPPAVDPALEAIDWLDGCAQDLELCQAGKPDPATPAADCVCPMWSCLTPPYNPARPTTNPPCRPQRIDLLRYYCRVINTEPSVSKCASYAFRIDVPVDCATIGLNRRKFYL